MTSEYRRSGAPEGIPSPLARLPKEPAFPIENQRLHTLFVRALGNVANHPFEYAKLLIQLGYEPYPPTPGKYLTQKVLYFPNVFQYVKYIKSVDGFTGCYRGLGPRLLSNSLHFFVSHTLIESYSPIVKNFEDEEENQEYHEESRVLRPRNRKTDNVHRIFIANTEAELAVKQTCWEVVCISAGAIVAQPFHVIAVRTMAEFVGREAGYKTIWSSIQEIFNNEGLVGFFRGLFPRLLGESLYVIITAAVVYAMRKAAKESVPNYVSGLAGSYAANSLTYQFTVVSNNMIVNGTSLAVGNPPFTPLFPGWTDAWKYLRQERQLGRGASMLGRFYTGRVANVEGDGIRPVSAYFGPIHPKGLGVLEKKEAAAASVNILRSGILW